MHPIEVEVSPQHNPHEDVHISDESVQNGPPAAAYQAKYARGLRWLVWSQMAEIEHHPDQ